MERQSFTLVVSLLILGQLGLSSDAQNPPQAPAFTTENVTLASFDGTMLAGTLYKPEGAGPFPALLGTHGYPGHRFKGYVVEPATRFATLGYLVLTYDSRGFGESRGETSLDGPNEVKDAQAWISWLAKRPDVLLDAPDDPRLGMFGECYAGGIQLLLAETDPRVDVLAPQTTWENLLEALMPNGVVKTHWIHLLFAAGQAETHGIPTSASDYPTHFRPDAEGAFLKLTEWYASVVALNDATDEIRRELGEVRSTDAAKLRTPVLFIQGWNDTLFDITHTQNMFAKLRANGVPAKIILSGIGHGGYSLNHNPAAEEHVKAVREGWFDYHLRGNASAELVNAWPVETYDYWERAFVQEADWPSLRSAMVSYFLKGTRQAALTGGASLEPASSAGEVVELVNSGATTSYTETSGLQTGAFASAPERDAPGTAVRFQTSPLSADTRLLGSPIVSLNLSTTAATDTRVFLKIQDVAADGTADTVFNLVTPLRLSGGYPGTVVPVTVKMAPINHLFRTGHRIALTVTTGDWAFAASREPAALGISTTATQPSRIDLPVYDPAMPADPVAPIVELYETNANLTAGETFVFRVLATDNHWLAKIDVEGAPAFKATREGNEWVVELSSLDVGRYEIFVRGTDLSGNSATAGPLTIQVASQSTPGTPSVVEDPAPGPVVVLAALIVAVVLIGRFRRRRINL